MSLQSDVTDDGTREHPLSLVVKDHGPTTVEVLESPLWAKASLELLVNQSQGIRMRDGRIQFGGFHSNWITYEVVALIDFNSSLLLRRCDD